MKFALGATVRYSIKLDERDAHAVLVACLEPRTDMSTGLSSSAVSDYGDFMGTQDVRLRERGGHVVVRRDERIASSGD